VGFEITRPLPVTPVFEFIAEVGQVPAAEMWEVFNMGCGFCAVVAAREAERAVGLLSERHPGTAVIGHVTDAGGRVSVPSLGIEGEGGRIRAL
jgi:phosphoribosylformylglycinamidine cyclo-ligase